MLAACVGEIQAPLELATLGAHEVPVGATLLLSIVASDVKQPEVTLLEAPATLQLLQPWETDEAEPGAVGVLAWQPSAFDLAPTPVGADRAPGKWQRLLVRVCDAEGRFAVATGKIRAVPATPRP